MPIGQSLNKPLRRRRPGLFLYRVLPKGSVRIFSSLY